MDFEFEQTLHGTPDAVLDLLLDRDFLEARSALPKLGDAEVLQLERDAATARLRVRLRFTGELSSAVTAVVDPSKLTWVDDATFELPARGARHTILPDSYAERLTCAYDDVLHAADAGTRRALTGSVKVKAFLVGGKVEGAIVSGLREYTEAEADLLNDWLRR